MTRFIDEHRERLGVGPICRELEVSESAYYRRRRDAPSPRARRDVALAEKIRAAHERSRGTYGAWRIWKHLNRGNVPIARCTVERLMRAQGLQGVIKGQARCTTTPGRAAIPAADLVPASSPPIDPMSCGWPTSPSSAPGRDGPTSPL